MAPALESIGSDLQITSAAERQLVLSIFLLAYAIGPFVMSPCSEVWGRVPVIRCGNTVFILFTSLCGIATSQGQIIAFRFLAGLGGSASVGMGSGVLTDCWRPEERGKGIAVYQLTQVLGPAVGPIGTFLHISFPDTYWEVRAQRSRSDPCTPETNSYRVTLAYHKTQWAVTSPSTLHGDGAFSSLFSLTSPSSSSLRCFSMRRMRRGCFMSRRGRCANERGILCFIRNGSSRPLNPKGHFRRC